MASDGEYIVVPFENIEQPLRIYVEDSSKLTEVANTVMLKTDYYSKVEIPQLKDCPYGHNKYTSDAQGNTIRIFFKI